MSRSTTEAVRSLLKTRRLGAPERTYVCLDMPRWVRVESTAFEGTAKGEGGSPEQSEIDATLDALADTVCRAAPRSRVNILVGPSMAPVLGLAGGSRLSRSDWQRFATHQFGELLGASLSRYMVSHDGFGLSERLACAMPRSVIDAVSQIGTRRSDLRLQLQPVLAAALNIAAVSQPAAPYLVVAETAHCLHAAAVVQTGVRVAVPFSRLSAESGPESRPALYAGTPTVSRFLEHECALMGVLRPPRTIWVDMTADQATSKEPAELPDGWTYLRPAAVIEVAGNVATAQAAAGACH